MHYLITFLEGIITFISPCFLPMLPIYISYMAGTDEGEKRYTALKNAVGFVLGFTLIFVAMGAFAGSIGKIINTYHNTINLIAGAVVILLGLNFTGIFKIGFLNKTLKLKQDWKITGFFSSILFGIVFSIGWTPCVGAFLGSALMLASQRGSMLQGMFMLVLYSLGLGIPFLISAVLIDKMKNTFAFIKEHYGYINTAAGIFLIIIGLMMMSGYLGKFLSYLSI